MSNRSFTKTAETFGAKIEIDYGSKAMCFVIGRVSPIAAINAAQGIVAAKLSETRALVVVDLKLLPILQRHPDIEIAGPVSIDAERFARFANLVGVKS
jgi:hypothetical protein